LKAAWLGSLFYIFVCQFIPMFQFLAKINKLLLPSFTRRQLDMAKAKKWELALIAWRYYVTIRALEKK